MAAPQDRALGVPESADLGRVSGVSALLPAAAGDASRSERGGPRGMRQGLDAEAVKGSSRDRWIWDSVFFFHDFLGVLSISRSTKLGI